jgi:hypothetical protein
MDPAADDARDLGEGEGPRRDNRPPAADPASTRSWRAAHDASILVDAATDS